MTAFGKLEGLAGRLVLVIHVMENPFSIMVGKDVVERVIDLLRGYIIPAYRFALGEVGGMFDDSFDKWVIDHIIHISADNQAIDLRTLKRSARRQLEGKTEWQKDQLVLDAMLILEQAGWAIQVESELHKHKVTWALNPSISTMFKEYRERVIVAKQRHADYIYRYAYEKGYERKVIKGFEDSMMKE